MAGALDVLKAAGLPEADFGNIPDILNSANSAPSPLQAAGVLPTSQVSAMTPVNQEMDRMTGALSERSDAKVARDSALEALKAAYTVPDITEGQRWSAIGAGLLQPHMRGMSGLASAAQGINEQLTPLQQKHTELQNLYRTKLAELQMSNMEKAYQDSQANVKEVDTARHQMAIEAMKAGATGITPQQRNAMALGLQPGTPKYNAYIMKTTNGNEPLVWEDLGDRKVATRGGVPILGIPPLPKNPTQQQIAELQIRLAAAGVAAGKDDPLHSNGENPDIVAARAAVGNLVGGQPAVAASSMPSIGGTASAPNDIAAGLAQLKATNPTSPEIPKIEAALAGQQVTEPTRAAPSAKSQAPSATIVPEWAKDLAPPTDAVKTLPLQQLQGDDVLHYFINRGDPANALKIRQVANGDIQIPSAARNNPMNMQLLQFADQYKPGTSAIDFPVRKKLQEDFTSGLEGRTVNNLNTAVGHLKTLSDMVDQLHGSNLPEIGNWVGGRLNEWDGDVKKILPAWQSTTETLSGELAKVLSGKSAPADAEIQRIAATLSPNMSAEAKVNVINKYIELMGSRLDSLKSQYAKGMGRSSEGLNLLDPKSEAVLAELRAKAGGGGKRFSGFKVVP